MASASFGSYSYNGISPRVDPTAFIAPTAVLIGHVEVKAHASVYFGAVLRGDLGAVVIGEGAVVQDNCVLHGGPRGLWVGPGVSIGHSAVLNDCRVEAGALVGILATVLDGAVIGEESIIGSGSVVMEDTQVPPRVLMAGAPAVQKKVLSGRALWWVQNSAPTYREIKDRYLDLAQNCWPPESEENPGEN